MTMKPSFGDRMHVHIKICGLTNLADAQAAVVAGADMLGMIFYENSPRYITPDQASDLLDGLRRWWNTVKENGEINQSNYPSFPVTVGVFVNSTAPHVQGVMDLVGLDLIQLHGDEPEEMLSHFRGSAFKALRPAGNAAALHLAAQFAPLGPAHGPQLLLDAYDSHAYGGTGKRADLEYRPPTCPPLSCLLLAGGLTPDNVALAIKTVRPWGVDVSSGVETRPAHKDHEAIRRFVSAVRLAQASITS